MATAIDNAVDTDDSSIIHMFELSHNLACPEVQHLHAESILAKAATAPARMRWKALDFLEDLTEHKFKPFAAQRTSMTKYARRTDTTDAADMKPVEVQGQLLRPGLERLIYMHLPSLACDILASKDPHAKGMTLLTLDQIRRKLPHVWRHATKDKSGALWVAIERAAQDDKKATRERASALLAQRA